jgi:hypothetical protein
MLGRMEAKRRDEFKKLGRERVRYLTEIGGIADNKTEYGRTITQDSAIRNAWLAWLVALAVSSVGPQALAKDCDAKSTKGDICICNLADLHPTQPSVGMVEVRKKAQKLQDEIGRRSEPDFLKYVLKHDKQEPVIVGPNGIFYITDHHHMARALYEVGASETYCEIIDNLSNVNPDEFWIRLERNNELYLGDQNGNPIARNEIPAAVKDMSNDPFRSLAGAVRESCGFEKDAHGSSGEDYLEFQWADYFRTHWAQTGIATKDIDLNFDSAVNAALNLAAQKQAASLPGYTGKISCD